MSEGSLVVQFFLRLIPLLVFALCYILGGRSGGPGKWVRRYIGPILFTLSCAILALVFGEFSWKILVLLIFAPVLTMPYNSRAERTLYVAAMTGSGMICGLVLGSPLGYLQAAISFCVGIFFTESHPVPAVCEEGIIALCSVLLIPFMV